MLKPEFSGQFKRDYKLAVKRGCDPKKLETVITMLCAEQPLPAEFRDHALTTRLAAGLPDQARDSGLTVDPNRNAQRSVLAFFLKAKIIANP